MRGVRAGLVFALSCASLSAIVHSTDLGATSHEASRKASRKASRAAPGVIVFAGGPLRKAIVLSNWTENQRLMMAAIQHVAVDDTALARRQKIEVTMYWGAMWSSFAATPDSLALLGRIREAQHGAYYPASHGEAAVWVYGPTGTMAKSTRLLTSDGIAILRAHLLPVAVK
jgi:hypothetical protein